VNGAGSAGPSFSRPPPPAALTNLMQPGAFALPKLTVAWTGEGQMGTHPRPIAEGDSDEGISPVECRQQSGTMKKSASAHRWF
jgi:hypothetical protein